ncbi:unnamed protein product [Larinioides sclopetarius]|uniref:Kinesin light chain n=1 Tax=Larinioides sclopetarius TaxID=280406 RepID=A0AAV2BUN2_9ARAC
MNSLSVLENLKGKNESMMKSAIRAKNQEGKTLIEVAYLCGFLKIDELQMLFETDLVQESKSVDKYLHEKKYSETLLALKKNILRKKGAIFSTDNHPVLDVEVKLVKVYQNLGDLDKAVHVLRKVYERRKNSLGDVHPKTLSDKTYIAFLLTKQGKTQEALRIFEAVYKIGKETLEPDDLKMIEFEMVFTSTLFEMRKFDEVLKINNEVEQKCAQKKDIQYQIGLAYFQFSTAEILSRRGKYSEALKLYEGVYETRKSILTSHHSSTLKALRGIAIVLDRLEKYDESIEVFSKILVIQKSCLSVDHIDILQTEFHIGDILYKQGMHLRALKIFVTLEPKLTAAVLDSDLMKANRHKIETIKNELSSFGCQNVFERIQNHIRGAEKNH